MHTMSLLENIEFHATNPFAQPLLVEQTGRILRFALAPGQKISEHNAPTSPFYVVILKGRGRFSGGNGESHEVGPMTLLAFAPGENHAVEALDDELIFVGFLQGAPGARQERTGGEIGRT